MKHKLSRFSCSTKKKETEAIVTIDPKTGASLKLRFEKQKS